MRDRLAREEAVAAMQEGVWLLSRADFCCPGVVRVERALTIPSKSQCGVPGVSCRLWRDHRREGIHV